MHIQPSEFWQMSVAELSWLLVDPEGGSGLTKDEADELLDILNDEITVHAHG